MYLFAWGRATRRNRNARSLIALSLLRQVQLVWHPPERPSPAQGSQARALTTQIKACRDWRELRALCMRYGKSPRGVLVVYLFMPCNLHGGQPSSASERPACLCTRGKDGRS